MCGGMVSPAGSLACANPACGHLLVGGPDLGRDLWGQLGPLGMGTESLLEINRLLSSMPALGCKQTHINTKTKAKLNANDLMVDNHYFYIKYATIVRRCVGWLPGCCDAVAKVRSYC